MTTPSPFRIAALLALVACEPMAPSGSPLQPVSPAARPVAGAAVPAPSGELPPPNSPFVEEDPFTEGPEDPDADPSGADLLLKAQLDAPKPTPAQAPANPVMPAPAPARTGPPLGWDGTGPVEGTGSWGVTLLATLLEVQPPRAVVALPDGTERVVQPGTFLPEHRLVVLAVGRDAVQLAHIEPMGFKSKVETSTIRSLFGGN